VVFTIIMKSTAESCHLISLAKEGKSTKDHQLPVSRFVCSLRNNNHVITGLVFNVIQCVSPLLGYLKAIVTKTLEELYLGHDPTFRVNVITLSSTFVLFSTITFRIVLT
jgi:hypothetical protein